MNTANSLLRHWLVVDDDPALGELLAQALRGLGCAKVEQFTSAIEVLARPGAPLGAFGLVITDRDMPGLDGLEFARRLHTLSPATRILLVTAQNDDLSAAELRRSGISAVLPKPFSLSHLESIVRTLTGAPVPANCAPALSGERRAA